MTAIGFAIAIGTVSLLTTGGDAQPVGVAAFIATEPATQKFLESLDRDNYEQVNATSSLQDSPKLGAPDTSDVVSTSTRSEAGKIGPHYVVEEALLSSAQATVRNRAEEPPQQRVLSQRYAALARTVIQESATFTETKGVARHQQPFELAALGPVESVSLTEEGASHLVVLGQSFLSAQPPLGVSAGDYVFAGSVDGGQLDFLIPVGEQYQLGVSEVRVVGAIDTVDSATAHFSIGAATFDYSHLLAGSPMLTISEGDVVTVAGNQVSHGGSILLGIHGSGIGSLQGIHGSGTGSLQGIHGSGIGSLQGIHGSGTGSLQGIHGSGSGSLQGIHGSGTGSLQGIHGSGTGSLQGIHGSGSGSLQ